HAEANRARVLLAFEQQVARHLRRLTEAERQEAARERVERAEVPHLGAAERRAQDTNHPRRRHRFGLVDQKDAGHTSSSSRGRAGPRKRASTRSAVSGTSSEAK